jgi:hypothetical protein
MKPHTMLTVVIQTNPDTVKMISGAYKALENMRKTLLSDLAATGLTEIAILRSRPFLFLRCIISS